MLHRERQAHDRGQRAAELGRHRLAELLALIVDDHGELPGSPRDRLGSGAVVQPPLEREGPLERLLEALLGRDGPLFGLGGLRTRERQHLAEVGALGLDVVDRPLGLATLCFHVLGELLGRAEQPGDLLQTLGRLRDLEARGRHAAHETRLVGDALGGRERLGVERFGVRVVGLERSRVERLGLEGLVGERLRAEGLVGERLRAEGLVPEAPRSGVARAETVELEGGHALEDVGHRFDHRTFLPVPPPRMITGCSSGPPFHRRSLVSMSRRASESFVMWN